LPKCIALAGLGRAPPVQELTSPAVPIRRSVQPGFVVCLECGFRTQMLRRHPRVQHGVKPEDYRARWILPIGYPLTAPDYSARRSRWPRNSASDANRVLWRLARGPPLAAAAGIPRL
jgi:predicted transcriptional regulator